MSGVRGRPFWVVTGPGDVGSPWQAFVGGTVGDVGSPWQAFVGRLSRLGRVEG